MADPIRAGALRQGSPFPAQPDPPLVDQPVDRGVNGGHHRAPPGRVGRIGGERTRHLARAERRAGSPHGEERQCHVARAVAHGTRRRRRDDRRVVIGSGFGGGCQSGGGAARGWLLPSPIAPGRWRSSPVKSACAAASAEAPPRIALIMSRQRRASSKSSAAAAASILQVRLSIVSDIGRQRTTAPSRRALAAVPILAYDPSQQGEARMLTVHHLGKSQSERIVWLCEELGIAYDLKRYDRDSRTMLAPPDYKALHPIGAAPVITDGDVVLAESAAIVEYIIARHGGGRLAVSPDQPGYPDYLYWFHFVNGSLQPALGRGMILRFAGVAPDHPTTTAFEGRRHLALETLAARLGAVPYLAGADFTAADVMIVFTLTTMRYFAPFDLAPYPAIRAYLQRIAARPAYQAAMAKGDPGMDLLLT